MSDFKIGAVVALKSHAYLNDNTAIIFSGEPQLISPLMVVVERLEETKSQFDEKSGESISEKGQSTCKCIWYSNKTHQFEEAWLSSKLLKIIKVNDLTTGYDANQLENDVKALVGSQVIFKTSNIELGKKKSSLSVKDSEPEKNTITALLSFVSPVMQVIQVTKFKTSDVKEPIYDSISGKPKRFFTTWLIKCKWFNPIADKMSEKILPLDSLIVINPIDENYIISIKNAINQSKFLKNEQILIKPKSISYRNGYYILRAYDFLKNKVKDFNINKLAGLELEENYFSDKAPFFNPITAEVLSKKEAIIKAEKDKNYLRIVYKKKNGELTVRTLKDYSFKELNNAKGVMTDYLHGYCFLRKAERIFKVKRIQSLEILKLIMS